MIAAFCCAALFFGSAMQAQDHLFLTLEQALKMAQDQSPAASIAKDEFDQAGWQFRAFQRSLLPQLSLSLRVPNFNRSISRFDQDDGTSIFLTQSQAFSNADLSLSQIIPWTGGNLTITSGLQRIDQFGDADTLFWQSTPLFFSYSQSIFQFNPIKWNRRQQALNYQIAEREFAESREALAVDIAGKFFDLYIAEITLQNAASNVAFNDTIFQVLQGRFNVGKIAENDLLQGELALLNDRAQLASIELDVDRHQKALRLALNISEDTKISIIPPASTPEISVNPEKAVQQALENRSDILQRESQLLSAERILAQARSNARLNALLTASYGLNQSADNVPDLYRDPLDAQGFNVNLQIPLFQWGQGRAQVRSAEAAKREVETSNQVQAKEFEQSVYFSALDYLQLQNQVRLAAKADTIARRRFDVTKQRYLIGKVDITNMQLAQNQKDGARQNYMQVLKRFWIAFFDLRRLTLYDFQSDRSLFQERP